MWTISFNILVFALIQGPSFLPGLQVDIGNTVFEDKSYTVGAQPKSALILP